MPGIKSCEADQPIELTDPIESEAEEGFVQNSNGSRNASSRVSGFQQPRVDGTQQQVESSQEIATDAHTSYGDSTASTGEILPYGVKAVRGGQDVSTKGNAGKGCYAFVIDSGVLDTTGDLMVNKAWSRNWVSGESAFTGMETAMDPMSPKSNCSTSQQPQCSGCSPGAEVISLKIFGSNGGGASYGKVIAGVNYATSVNNQNGHDKNKYVINTNLGGGFSSGLDQAVRNAANQGIKIRNAAGHAVGNDADFWSPAPGR